MNINWDNIFRNHAILDTERCHLRKPTAGDIPFVFQMMSDEKVTQYLGRPPMSSLDEAAKQVERYLSGFDNQTSMTWVICSREDMAVMGTISVFDLAKAHYRAEVGYLLSPDYWGKGIMSEVLPIVIDFAFTSMHLHSLFGQIDPENDASRHLLEKFGFVQEAYFREDFYHPVKQAFTDTAILCLIKPEWQKWKLQSS